MKRLKRLLLGTDPERRAPIIDGSDGNVMWADIGTLLSNLGNSHVEGMGDRALGEVNMRLIQVMEETAYQQRVGSSRLERLTLWLVGLTVSIVVLTVVLAVQAIIG